MLRVRTVGSEKVGRLERDKERWDGVWMEDGWV